MCVEFEVGLGKVIALFSAETAARVNEGADHVLVVHSNGNWEVRFVEDGQYLVKAYFYFGDEGPQEAIDHIAG